MRVSALVVLLLWAALVWALPLLGLLLAGAPIDAFLVFPPRPREVAHATFSWLAFAFYALPVAGAIALTAFAMARARFAMGHAQRAWFPWWGWLGLLLVAASWFLAWRGELVEPQWRRHVFTPLWLGAVVTGACSPCSTVRPTKKVEALWQASRPNSSRPAREKFRENFTRVRMMVSFALRGRTTGR